MQPQKEQKIMAGTWMSLHLWPYIGTPRNIRPGTHSMVSSSGTWTPTTQHCALCCVLASVYGGGEVGWGSDHVSFEMFYIYVVDVLFYFYSLDRCRDACG